MNLGWRDMLAALLTVGTATLAAAAVWKWTTFITVRWAIVGMLVLGILTCAIGSYNAAALPPLYSILMGGLVIITSAAALLGLVFNAKAYVVVMAAGLVLLWIAATARHAIGSA